MPASIYIKNLPPEANKLFLYENFAPFGAVTSVKILTDDTNGLCKGVGFVNYTDSTAAQRAIEAFNGYQLGDKIIQVSLQATRVRS